MFDGTRPIYSIVFDKTKFRTELVIISPLTYLIVLTSNPRPSVALCLRGSGIVKWIQIQGAAPGLILTQSKFALPGM